MQTRTETAVNKEEQPGRLKAVVNQKAAIGQLSQYAQMMFSIMPESLRTCSSSVIYAY